MAAQRYEVVEYHDGKRFAAVAGMGRNAGKWDSDHSRSRAYYYARQLNLAKRSPTLSYRVEEA